jgi:hypothetical protein
MTSKRSSKDLIQSEHESKTKKRRCEIKVRQNKRALIESKDDEQITTKKTRISIN